MYKSASWIEWIWSAQNSSTLLSVARLATWVLVFLLPPGLPFLWATGTLFLALDI